MRRKRQDHGFALIELLVVMIIIGILAAIAIPTFLAQRTRARDTSTKADVSDLGKEVATFFVGNNSANVTLDFSTPGRVLLSDGVLTSSMNLTNGTATPMSGGSLNMNDSTNWCVALTDAAGAVKNFRYSARGGLEVGTC